MRNQFSAEPAHYLAAVALIFLLLMSAGPVVAQEEGRSKLSVHGFLTQAWATGSNLEGRFPLPDGTPAGPTNEELALGISEDGTFDYRNMAIQFRYQISDKDVMTVQLSSRALGNSPITRAEDEVELDWAFYERRLADNTSVKVGRVQIPYGIFNEIRDVGTILPFYRPAFVVYREGAFTSETVDGLSFSHAFAVESDWSLRADGYFGQWDLVELDLFSGEALTATSKDSFGAQLWLSTPIYGLRFGLAYQHREVSGGSLRAPGDETIFDDYLLSIDGSFNHWSLRAEFRQFENDPEQISLLGTQDFVGTFEPFYVQLGWHATSNLRFYLQYEEDNIEASADVFLEDQNFTSREDIGFSVNYLFNPSLVLKAEYHDVSGTDQGFVPVFPPGGGFGLQPIYADLDDGNYTIISLSASF